MKWNEVFCNTFKAMSERLAPEIERRVNFMLPSWPMVEACRASEFDFLQVLIGQGVLTSEQALHAAECYRLGKTKSGRTIFWMIDDMMTPLDAHIGDGWLSQMLKAREELLAYWPVKHCLFGLHLVDGSKPICIVESEASAVILSELYPECVWLAYGVNSHLVMDMLAPLQGSTVTIYPRTDPTMSNYVFFLDYAQQAEQYYDIRLRIDNTLELYAAEEQKQRCIDIVDFVLDSAR